MPTPFLQAAVRTYDDAEGLHEAGRLGTADHLYGLACECALKAILCGYQVIPGTQLPPNSAYKVHVNLLWNSYLNAAQGRAMPPLHCCNPFAGWKVHDRYHDDSVFTEDRVAAHRDGAKLGMVALQEARLNGMVS